VLAKWSMPLTGNYGCITPHEPQSIRDAVHTDLSSRSMTMSMPSPGVSAPIRKIRCLSRNMPRLAESLLKPSSAARAVAAGAPFIERVAPLVKLISHQLGVPNAEIDRTVETADQELNEKIVQGGSGAT
jgi:hypothetical protein